MFPIFTESISEPWAYSPDSLNQRLHEVLHTGSPELDQIIAYLLDEPGKLLRPRMVFMTSSFFPSNPMLVRDAAVALELIHLASLVHDDVVDQSSMRRGRDSLYRRWGSKASVLVGDYLFATAFQLINQHHTPAILAKITRTIQLMCMGEIMQLSNCYNLNLSLHDYMEKIYRKTACLFECCCQVGALASTMPEAMIEALEQYGLNLGLGYQIVDDVLDFISTSERLGKPAGSDLLEGNYTLPVLYALQDESIGPILKQILSSQPLQEVDLPSVVDLLERCQALQRSLQTARAYLQTAQQVLHLLPESPHRGELETLGQSLIHEYFRVMAPEFAGNELHEH